MLVQLSASCKLHHQVDTSLIMEPRQESEYIWVAEGPIMSLCVGDDFSKISFSEFSYTRPYDSNKGLGLVSVSSYKSLVILHLVMRIVLWDRQ